MKNKVTYISSPGAFLDTVSKKIKQTDIVLDVGSGINPQKYIKPVVHICAEPYEQYADHLISKVGNKNRFFIVLKQKWDEVVKTIPKNWVDTLITLDVIEHIEKKEWVQLLKDSIKIVRKQVVIFTPYGFMPQEVPEWMKDAWWLDWAEWQKHKSWWTEKDFWKWWDVYICREFHFYDAITKEKFKTPYWALFAIYNKDISSKKNLYSIMRSIYSFITLKILFYIGINKVTHNTRLKLFYNKYIKKYYNFFSS